VVETMLSDAGVPPRPELVEWWMWHDGAGPGRQEDSELAESWHLLRLEDALELRRELAAAYADAGAPDRWPASWQPLLAFAGAPILCVDGATGTVHIEDAGFPDPAPPQFSSLEDLVRTVLRAVDEGITARSAANDPDLRRLWWW
jgi:hypothetical protein